MEHALVRTQVALQLSGPYPFREHTHRLGRAPAGTEICAARLRELLG